MQIQPTESTLRRHAERVRKAALDASSLLDWLEAEGFTPRAIVIAPERKPVVQIALSSKCAWLKEKHNAYKHILAQGFITWRADMMGCRVEWIEGGH